jgi:hypothetical protein
MIKKDKIRIVPITIASIILGLAVAAFAVLPQIHTTDASTATLQITNTFSYSNPNPSLGHATQFFTHALAIETGFNNGEQVNTTYKFPAGSCSVVLTANSKGEIRTFSPECSQGSSGYLGYGAHEGTKYTVTAVGVISKLIASTTFVPRLTNGSSESFRGCAVQCSSPTISNSLLHLMYFNPNENKTYNDIIAKHNSISQFRKNNGTDFAASFNKTNLDQYHNLNLTRIILEYNDSGTNNGIVNGIKSGYSWIAYDNELHNGAHSTPCIEISVNCKINHNKNTLINASAVWIYTDDASLRVKAAKKNFAWKGQFIAIEAAYTHVNWSRIDLVTLQLQRNTTTTGYNNFTTFNSTIAQISDYIRTQNPHTLIFVEVNPGNFTLCNCNISSLTYSLQYARFHASTPTKWLYDGVTLVIETTPPRDVDTFDTYLER